VRDNGNLRRVDLTYEELLAPMETLEDFEDVEEEGD
jgi:hypothetical protein